MPMIPAVEHDRTSSIPFLSSQEESSAQLSPAANRVASFDPAESRAERDSAAVETIDEQSEVKAETFNGKQGTLAGGYGDVVGLPPNPTSKPDNEDSIMHSSLSTQAIPRIVRRPVETPFAPTVAESVKTPDKVLGNKPPRVGVNIEWVRKGPGWDCREVYYVGDKRRRKHIGHIGRQKWEEMQAKYQGEMLQEALRTWIEERRSEKSIGEIPPVARVHDVLEL